MGNFVELMDRHELVYLYFDPVEALHQAVQLLEQEGVKAE